MSDRPRVIGHRGASEDRPGNTMAAFEEALRQGAAGIEFDVRLSSDGVPVPEAPKSTASRDGAI